MFGSDGPGGDSGVPRGGSGGPGAGSGVGGELIKVIRSGSYAALVIDRTPAPNINPIAPSPSICSTSNSCVGSSLNLPAPCVASSGAK